MKSPNLLRLAGVALAAAVVISCGEKSDYRNAIPADASLVCSIDNQSLTKKADFGNAGANPAYKLLLDSVANASNLSAEQKEYLLSLLRNPGEAGIDQHRPSYLFSTLNSDSNMELGLLFSIGDKAKFDRAAEFVSARNGGKIIHENGLDLLTEPAGAMSENFLLAYNRTAALLLFHLKGEADLPGRAKALLGQERAQSLFADKQAAELLSRPNDLNLYLSYAGLLKALPLQQQLSGQMSEILQHLSLGMSLNFEQGKITAHAEPLFSNQADRDKLLKQYNYTHPQTGKLLGYMPRNSMLVVGMGLNGEKIFKMLTDTPQYSLLVALPVVKQAFEAIDGDVDIALTGLTPDGNPQVALLATVNNPAIVETLKAQAGPMAVKQIGDKQYQLTMGGDITIDFGVKGNILYFTNDPAVLSALKGKEIESMKALREEFVGQDGSLLLDIKKLTNLRESLGIDPNVVKVLRIFNTMIIKGEVNGKGSMVVNMTDTDRNALATICTLFGSVIEGGSLSH